MPNNETIVVGDWLEDKGFDLLSIMDPIDWPNSLTESFVSLGIDIPSLCRIVLIGSAGSRLWKIVREEHWQDRDPIDRYAIRITEELVARKWKGKTIRWLYPGSDPIPLQRLCRFAGWSHPSLLGLDIHPNFGTWFACRAAFIIESAIECTTRSETVSPCDTCVDKPCQAECPSGAVREKHQFGLDKCGSYRVTEKSLCCHRCVSRMICPIGSAWRYSDDQLDYHGALSLKSIQRIYLRNN